MRYKYCGGRFCSHKLVFCTSCIFLFDRLRKRLLLHPLIWKGIILYMLMTGEMAELSNALVLKTSVPQGTGGSNPSFSADN